MAYLPSPFFIQFRYVFAEKGSPESVLSAVDKFCWTDGQWMMHVGDQKGITLDAEVLNST